MNPNIIPKNAPIIPKKIDSVKNIPKMTLLVPPSAFKIPISLVLSTTDVYIVMMIPMDPTMSEITAMLEMNVEMAIMNLVMFFTNSKEFNMVT